jgi:hypothetical protein
MAKSDIKKLVATNPKVDEKKLYEILTVLRKLRKKGLSKSGYELDIPYTRQIKSKEEVHQ